MTTFLSWLIAICWLLFPILSSMAVNRVSYLYHENEEKAGFKLKKRTWGPTYGDTKRILKLS